MTLSPCLYPALEWPNQALDKYTSSFLRIFWDLQRLALPQHVFLWSSLVVLLPSNLLSFVLACLVFWVSRRLGSFPWPNLASLLSNSPAVSLWVWSRLSSVGTSSSTRASALTSVLSRNALSVGWLSHFSLLNPPWLFEPTRDPRTDKGKISNDVNENKKARSLLFLNFDKNRFRRLRINRPFPSLFVCNHSYTQFQNGGQFIVLCPHAWPTLPYFHFKLLLQRELIAM